MTTFGNAGWLNNGVPVVQARVQNGTTVAPVPATNVGANMLVSLDTQNSAGMQPETAAATAFQIAAFASELIHNTATSTTHTATLNTRGGEMVTESLSTAAGATYTFQIVNSLISSTSAIPQVQMHPLSDITGAAFEVTSITNSSGTAEVVFTNIGTAAASGTWAIQFHV